MHAHSPEASRSPSRTHWQEADSAVLSAGSWPARSAVAVLVVLACSITGPTSAQTPQRDPQLNSAVMLVRNALTAVNHGNLTGNYTVLRDLGGPAFRERNSASNLSVVFQRLRDQKMDLSPVLLVEPVFTQAPGLDQAGQLQLVGFFPTQPLQVHFRVAFQRMPAGWMIDTVSVAAIAPPNTNYPESPAAPEGPVNAAALPPANYTR